MFHCARKKVEKKRIKQQKGIVLYESKLAKKKVLENVRVKK